MGIHYRDEIMKNKSIMEFCLIPPPFGGATVFVKRLSDKLQKDGFLVGGYYNADCNDISIKQSSFYYRVQTTDSKYKIVRGFCQITRMIKQAVQMRNFDIIHYHGLENLKFIWFLHQYMKKKIVITVHSAMIESFYRRTDRVNRSYMYKLAKSDVQWIAVSNQARECMLRLPLKFKKDIPVIPAYIPIEKNSSKPLSKELIDYINSHNKIISFYARSFMLNDGVDVYGFTDALKLYYSLLKTGVNIGMVFCLSEDKDTDKIESLYSAAKELGVDDKIFWQIGAIDNIEELWKVTDVYVRPTSTDGDSVAVREVLDSGAQVVASDVCERPEGVITYKHENPGDFLLKTLKL